MLAAHEPVDVHVQPGPSHKDVSTGSGDNASTWCCELDSADASARMDSAAAHARHMRAAASSSGRTGPASETMQAQHAITTSSSQAGTSAAQSAGIAWLSAADGCSSAALIALATSCEVSWDDAPATSKGSSWEPQVSQQEQQQQGAISTDPADAPGTGSGSTDCSDEPDASSSVWKREPSEQQPGPVPVMRQRASTGNLLALRKAQAQAASAGKLGHAIVCLHGLVISIQSVCILAPDMLLHEHKVPPRHCGIKPG